METVTRRGDKGVIAVVIHPGVLLVQRRISMYLFEDSMLSRLRMF
jgi:hypothetical protein